MLDLDSMRWADLRTAYGSAENVPSLLAKLASATPDAWRNGSDEAWDDAWSSLCHQGTLATASYAALPHVVRIGRTRPATDRVMFWSFAGAVVAGRGATCPADLVDDFRDAVGEARRDAEAMLSGASLEADAAALLRAIAEMDGHAPLGRAFDIVTDGEFPARCPSCRQHVLFTRGGDASLEARAVDDRWNAVGMAAPVRHAVPSPRDVEVEHLLTLSAGCSHPNLHDLVRQLGGSADCPRCARPFTVRAALESFEQA